MRKKALSTFMLTVVAACLSLTSFAQARENPKEITFTQRSPGKLTSAKGWIKDPETGKWISHQNYVSSLNMSGGEGIAPGFNWISGAAFTYQGEKYFVFYYSFPTGTWTYPALHQGFNAFNSMGYVVMDLPQYSRIYKAVQTEKAVHIPVDGNYLMKPASTEAPLLTDITKYLTEEPTKYKMTGMDRSYVGDSVFADVQTISGKKIVRFDATGVLALSGAESAGYFETDLAQFKQILVPMTAAEQALGDSLVIATDPEIKKANEEKNRAAKAKADAEAAKQKALQEEREAAAKVIKDSIDLYNNTIGKIKDLQTSDTMFATSFAASKNLYVGSVPQWVAISSFTYDGKKKYMIYTKKVSSKGEAEMTGIICEASDYAALKAAIAAKDGSDFDVTTKLHTFYYHESDIKSAISKCMTGDTPHSMDCCFSFNITKKKVLFNMPDMDNCRKPHNYKDDLSGGYYQGDPVAFSKLVSLP